MENTGRKLPEHVRQAIDRHESRADKMDKERATMFGSKDDLTKVVAIRDTLATEKFASQRRVEHILSEFGLPSRHKVARRQIEERKTKV